MLKPKNKSDAVIDRVMQTFIDDGKLSGAVTLVADERNILHLSAVGERDIARHLPMEIDTIFWIASMTKLVTAAAIRMLVDENKVSIQDPVSKFIPEFSALKTPRRMPANLTLWHLLTHTSGLAEAPWKEAWRAKNLTDLMPMFLGLPLKFEPGAQWDYSQSGINTLGRIIEIVSGQSFEQFLQQRIFDPLGMKDTTFYPTQNQIKRLAISYLLTNGRLAPTDIKLLPGPVGDREHYPAANGGLFCTAEEYCRFCQMLLNDGMLEGRRYLTSASIREMTRDQTGELKAGFVSGSAWGLGFGIVVHPTGATKTLSPGTYGHGGAYGTEAWIDPIKRRIQILMIQRADVGNADDSEFRRQFHKSVEAEF
jgi:CubicO group peptidase (beta-lactamase class C family)